ncbi:MAG: alpha-L-rhamnosidase [Kiritimatiellae bacterium]|jgi:alpha-L-rhamnosidase|nr:alpha-L-rhamnosidase [Kiritimatiellia bacterium]
MKTDEKYTVTRKPLQQTEVLPAETRLNKDGTLFIDFGKAAFGTLLVPVKAQGHEEKLIVHLGEQVTENGRLERSPKGTIRYIRIEQDILPDQKFTRIVIPHDKRNTGPAAIMMPEDIGEVFPFRYAEIEAADEIDVSQIRQFFVHYPFDDSSSSFECSSEILNEVWNLCKYSIKATTFCGAYVDGDRERIPYEGDAYINQLGHYCVDSEYTLARYTHEYLIQYPTWPTEWILHSVMIAWADYMYTGETISLETFYDDLCAKTLIDLAGKDGLISTESELCTRDVEERVHLHHSKYIFDHGIRDLVDWPPGSFTKGGQGERDNHEMRPINTVVNAFHCHVLSIMSDIAKVLGHIDDHTFFKNQAELVKASINAQLFDQSQGVYIDGEGSRHASLHSNMFMLAFGLVPGDRRKSVIDFVKSRGMACSVYGAHYLLEALYLNQEDQYALELMTSQCDRSWWNMIHIGSTMTLEAWDLKYKSNLDWNHAWGAAPANIIPRFILGVRPLKPGFRKILIKPQLGQLDNISGIVPTIRGPIAVSLKNSQSGERELRVVIPENTSARIEVKTCAPETKTILIDGIDAEGFHENGHLVFDEIKAGTHLLTYK